MTRRIILLASVLLYTGVLAQRVGVGTDNPQAYLDVVGPATLNVPLFRISEKNTSVPYVIVTSQDGNVGINVLLPSEKLHVQGNVRFDGALMPGGNAGTTGQVLISQGPGAAPIWVDAPSIGD
ncbi:MAG: hypothetical protein GXO48_06030, partial [Chlorobi bacterium]|nr:hypothetical protein [Chlorobiota bacterium]